MPPLLRLRWWDYMLLLPSYGVLCFCTVRTAMTGDGSYMGYGLLLALPLIAAWNMFSHRALEKIHKNLEHVDQDLQDLEKQVTAKIAQFGDIIQCHKCGSGTPSTPDESLPAPQSQQ